MKFLRGIVRAAVMAASIVALFAGLALALEHGCGSPAIHWSRLLPPSLGGSSP